MSEFLTTEGLKTLRLGDAQAELETAIRSAFGAGTVLTPDTVLGKLVGILAERESLLWEVIQAVYDSSYPESASGKSLDDIAAITGITRNPALRSTLKVYLAGNPSLVVPAGSLMAVENAGDQFRLVNPVTLGGIGSVSITALSSLSGEATATAAGHGFAASDWVFVSGANENEYNGLVQVTDVPDTSTFKYAISGTPASPATGTIKADQASEGDAESVQTGPIQALAGTLNGIVNTITGWDRVENAVDAALGRDTEPDSAFRIRRLAALAGLGAAHNEAILGALLALSGVSEARIYENDTDAVQSGRPPHSFETLVLGGTDQDIADSLWANKAAGIATFGTEQVQVTDSQGDQHTVSFSRPSSIFIWVELDITRDAADFPANGDEVIRDAVVAWGDSLGIGADVVVFPYLLASFEDVPGILDVAVRIGTAASPTTDDNIAIQETEFAEFDTGRTTIMVLP